MIFLQILCALFGIIFAIIGIFSNRSLNKIVKRLNATTKERNARLTQAELTQQQAYLKTKKPAAATVGILFAMLLVLVAFGFFFRELVGNTNLAYGFISAVILLCAALQGMYRYLVLHTNHARKEYLRTHADNELKFFAYTDQEVAVYKSANGKVIVMFVIAAVLFLMASRF